jgi:hypothetical protein
MLLKPVSKLILMSLIKLSSSNHKYSFKNCQIGYHKIKDNIKIITVYLKEIFAVNEWFKVVSKV